MQTFIYINIQVAVTLGAGIKEKVVLPSYPERELNFYMTQLLSGHGCFRDYLHKFGHHEFPTCPNCIDVSANAKHLLFGCHRFIWPWEMDYKPNRLVDVVSNTAKQ